MPDMCNSVSDLSRCMAPRIFSPHLLLSPHPLILTRLPLGLIVTVVPSLLPPLVIPPLPSNYPPLCLLLMPMSSIVAPANFTRLLQPMPLPIAVTIKARRCPLRQLRLMSRPSLRPPHLRFHTSKVSPERSMAQGTCVFSTQNEISSGYDGTTWLPPP